MGFKKYYDISYDFKGMIFVNKIKNTLRLCLLPDQSECILLVYKLKVTEQVSNLWMCRYTKPEVHLFMSSLVSSGMLKYLA